jgi:hypothetical protein
LVVDAGHFLKISRQTEEMHANTEHITANTIGLFIYAEIHEVPSALYVVQEGTTLLHKI